jgi:hypothetical protein
MHTLRQQFDLPAADDAVLVVDRRYIQSVTYLIDALRGLIIEQGQSNYSLVLDFGVMITVFLIFLVIAARLYPELAHRTLRRRKHHPA